MVNKRKREQPSINTGATADIAFLLLLFFLVTADIVNDQGLMVVLPPKAADNATPVHERNIYKVHINSAGEVAAQGERVEDLKTMREEIKSFILNRGEAEGWSVSPRKAVVSLKAGRGVKYNNYIGVLDEVKGAYYDLYADNANLTNEGFRSLDLRKSDEKALYNKARVGIPMNISIVVE